MTRRAISCPTSTAIKSRRPSCWKSLDPSFLRLQFLQSSRNGFGVHVSVSPSEPGLLSFIRLYCYIYELYYEMNRALPSSISLSGHRRIRQRHPLRNHHSLSSHFFSFYTQINPYWNGLPFFSPLNATFRISSHSGSSSASTYPSSFSGAILHWTR